VFGFRMKHKTNKHKKSDKRDDRDDKGKKTGFDVDDAIPSSLLQCEKLVKSLLGNSSDIVIQAFGTQKAKAMIVYIDGLISKDLLDRDIISPLKANSFDGNLQLAIKTHYDEIDDIFMIIDEILQGQTALFYDGSKKAFIIDIKKWDKRSVETPDSETTIRGPREGFTESLRTNTALLRRKLRTPKLKIENMIIGRQGNTPIGIAYIEGIVNQDVLRELKSRLSTIDTDAVFSVGSIEQYLCKSRFSPITGIGSTQKPDVAAARILEGRVAVFCDGTPYVLTIPELFIENLQTSDDYYGGALNATVLRTLRLIGLFVATILPGLSVAVITYSQEMMPEAFLQTLIAATQKMPLPAGAEVFLLILMFELLKEAGIRLPKAVGSAITIVGALIVGDAAVKAGIVSAPAVIIVASTAVAGFIVPTLSEFVVLYRILFLFLGGTMGLVGIGVGMTIMLTHLASTESFGISILSSFSKYELRDGNFRFPLQSMKYRPASIAKDNVRRRG
jgi:spore germination protein KA